MTNTRILLLFAIIIAACNSDKPQQPTTQATGTAATPVVIAGETIAIDSMKVKDDWHDYHFVVEIATTNKQGVYSVLGTWGLFLAESSFTMPRGGKHLAPILRRTGEPYTYNIGFRKGGDTTFFPYYQVKGQHGQIKMKYIKAYSFENEESLEQ